MSLPHVPLIERGPELTFRAVLLGCVLGVLMTAANAYLGLYAGMTVSASIPAAVLSMGILRGIFRTGTIRENNIVQTIASAGESLAAGVIFTVPALVITGAWNDFAFWPVTLMALLGGVLGVVFMIPLRRALIVDEPELTYPEGVACAEVLEVGQQRGSGVAYVFAALLFGGGVKILVEGLGLIAGVVQGGARIGRTALYFGYNVSPALIAVGFIVGLNVAVLVFLGGLIGWLVGIPLYYLVNGYPTDNIPDVVATMKATWSSQIRYMGVGTMLVGGVWSIWGVRRGIQQAVRRVGASLRPPPADATGVEAPVDPTDRDLNSQAVLALMVIGAVLLVATAIQWTNSIIIGTTVGAIMVVASFFFVAVSSYVVGLVGSSNNPVSGMTISTVLLTAVLLLVFGLTGTAGIIACLGVAGVVCCAACTAGDVSQDLKTGHLIGATPQRQQIAQLIGIVAAVGVIAPVLRLLHATHGIGVPVREGVEPLAAPQANLFAGITRAVFASDGSMPWSMVGLGVVLGLILVVLDECLRRRNAPFRTHVMPVAVGIYLPWSLGVPILLGGIASALARRSKFPDRAQHRGVLLGSGLIAGEALAGIAIALLLLVRGDPFTLSISQVIPPIAGLAIILAVPTALVLLGRE